MRDRMDVTILGVNHGTASGWDGDESSSLFYDFVPVDGSILVPCSCLSIDLTTGKAEAYNDKNEVFEKYTLQSEWKAVK